MNLRTIVTSVVISFLLCCSALADRNLSREEITQLFKELTSNPKTTWIPAGTIEATKEEYRASKTIDEQQILNAISESIENYQNNDQKVEKTEYLQKMTLDAIPFNVRYRLSNEYTMKTTMNVRYDGKRVYSDIKVDSRQDSVQIPDELKNNYSTEEFNLDWNGRRIFCYDEEKTISYTPNVNHAMIDAVTNLPNMLIEPISSGFIPWGYNYFTYEKLIQLKSSAVEKSVDGRAIIQLTLTNPDGTELVFELDPEKAYVPLSWVINQPNALTTHQYSNYKLVAGSWIPTSIIIEKFDFATGNLLSGDYITITKISGETPLSESFEVAFTPNTLIEYTHDIAKPQLIYYYSNTANTELLLAERLNYIESESNDTQNCATAALQYAALQLGRDILNQQLSQIINPVDNTSSLQDIKNYAENLGFYCKVVTTDIQTLKNLSGCQAILHIPGRNHFELLDHVDDKYVWITDLSRNKFYYRIDINFFGMDWTEGTALLISNQPISLPADTTEIPDNKLVNYIGGSGYTCTFVLQEYHRIYCAFDGLNCYGLYQVFFDRLGCEAAESGACTESIFYKKVTWPCIDYPYLPYTCDIAIDQVQYYYMWACE